MHATRQGTAGSPPDPGDAAPADKARLLRALHRRPDVLVLPNAWDVTSAIVLAELPGVHALATTSAGMAAAQGVGDGERLSFGRLLAEVDRITSAVALPVTVDLEAGYGATAHDVATSVAEMIQAGAVGVNLEDGVPADQTSLLAPEAHAERITAVREMAERAGVPIVINARTDVFWRRAGSPAGRFADAVSRLRRYVAAGADCVFVPGFPGPGDDAPAMIGDLVGELAGTPVNLLAGSALPAVAELRALGVRRLSVGSALYRLAMAAARDAMGELLHSGGQAALEPASRLGYHELADALARGAR